MAGDHAAGAAGAAPYRADIDGLRAISVLAVLAYHAHLPYAGAGFLGVDVFFVISGFLITGLLLREKASTGRIDLAAFWARRVRRLAPAFLAMLLCVLLAAPFLTQRVSGETGELVRSALAALVVNANHYFLLEAGDYFGSLAEHNPLLHTWSLSVEEQFYLVWPILIAAALFRGRWVLPALTGALLLGSLLLAASWQGGDASKAFYLMPARAWQLMAGAALALLLHRRRAALPGGAAAALGLTGLALVVTPMVLGPSTSLGPLWLSALPVAGAVLMIFTGSSASSLPTVRLLAWAPMVYIGKISYPLYLWHWPLLVLIRGQRLHEPSLSLDLSALALSFILAALTHEFIEKGVWRRARGLGNRRILLGGLGASAMVAALVVLLGLWVRFGIGYSAQEQRLDASRRDRATTGCMFYTGFPQQDVVERCFPQGQQASVLLWGDSHAEHWQPALQSAATAEGVALGVLAANGCRPLPSRARLGTCLEFNQGVLQRLPDWRRTRNLKGLVIAARWADGMGADSPQLQPPYSPGQFYDRRADSQSAALELLASDVDELLARAEGLGLRVVVILPSPLHRYSSQRCLAVKPETACLADRQVLDAYFEGVEAVFRKQAAERENLRVLDPKDFMCQGRHCPMVLDGRIAYSDSHHVSRSYAQRSGRHFSQALRWLAGE